MISGTCGVCGRPGHRYGTTDSKHDFNAVACVNGLLAVLEAAEAERDALAREVEKLREALQQIDKVFEGWSYGTAYSCVEQMRLIARAVLSQESDQ